MTEPEGLGSSDMVDDLPLIDERWLRADVPAELLDGEVVAWVAERDRLVRLNREASVVWEHLDKPRTLAELRAAAEAAGCPPERSHDDVRCALGLLSREGLVIDVV